MHAITLVAAVGTLVVLERIWTLFVRERARAAPLFEAVAQRWNAGDSQGALQLCRGRAAVAGVLFAGLMSGVDQARTQAAVREALGSSLPRVSGRVRLVVALAGLAAMCGLLGTVMGMMDGTTCIATVSAEERAKGLAAALSLSLHTTGFGIAVAIALRAAAMVLRSRRDRVVADCELYGARVVQLVSRAAEPRPSARLAPYRDADVVA